MFLTMGVSLYTSRIIIDALGIEDYGLYNVVGGTVGLFTFFSASMQSATQRFLSFELGQNNKEKYNKVFNVNLVLYFFISLLILIIAETVGLWYITNKLNVPDGRENIVNIIYQVSIVATCLSILRIPYTSGIVSQEKMSFFAYVSILESILKLVIVYFIVNTESDKLVLYSILILVVTIIINAIYIIYCSRDRESLYKFSLSKDKSIYLSILSFSSWRLLGASAQMTEHEGVNLSLNYFFGTIINAANGIAFQVNVAVSGLVSSFQQAFQPQITKSFASQDWVYLDKIVKTSAKLSFLLLTFFIIPLSLNIDFILSVWLKEVPEYSAEFSILALANTLAHSFSAPLWMLILATGKIAKYQIYLSSIIILSVICDYLFLKYGYSPSIVFYVRIVTSTLIVFYRLYLLEYYYKINLYNFTVDVILKPTLLFVFFTGIIYYITLQYDNLFRLIISISAVISIYPIFIFFFLLKENEKSFVSKSLKKYLKKIQSIYVK